MHIESTSPLTADRHYRLVARAIAHLRTHARQQPSLQALADAVHLSPFHLQRVFSEWAGLSPKRFLQVLTKDHALQCLQEEDSVLATSANCGLSSGSRLHDLMVQCVAMTPGEIQAQGRGLSVGCGVAPTPFGPALLGWTARGICHLAFLDDADPAQADPCAVLQARWPHAQVRLDHAEAARWASRVFAAPPGAAPVPVLLRGTNFQVQVWQALVALPPGRVVSYRQLAQRAGVGSAVRAVGHAMAENAVGFLIPCHRVIQSSGAVGQYRWGSDRKLAMQAWEWAQRSA